MKRCPECGAKIKNRSAVRCPACTAPLPAPRPSIGKHEIQSKSGRKPFIVSDRRISSENDNKAKRKRKTPEKASEAYKLTCKCCGKTFESKDPHAMYCNQNCRGKFYRKEAAESRKRECVCPVCGKSFVTIQYNAIYCCDECSYQGQRERQRKKKAAKRAEERARKANAIADEKSEEKNTIE